ncbi:MAG: hypothetical protein AAF577_01165 [Pseudomonadota bacterium]
MLAAAALIMIVLLAGMTISSLRERSKEHLAIRIRVDDRDRRRDPRHHR